MKPMQPIKPALLFLGVLLALPAAFGVIRLVAPLVPPGWRTFWAVVAFLGIPAAACGLAYLAALGPPAPPPDRCGHCGADIDDPQEPHCLSCGKLWKAPPPAVRDASGHSPGETSEAHAPEQRKPPS